MAASTKPALGELEALVTSILSRDISKGATKIHAEVAASRPEWAPITEK
jgi:hypothetical protein